jgi:single-strand DNA-binding protein
MNSINLVGRITKDLDLKCTPNGKYVCDFSLAVNRVGTDKADFINCQIWGKQAENLTQYQGKGSLVGIVGSIRVDTYEVEGTKRQKTYVLASNVEFLSSKKEENAQNIQNTVQNVEEDPFSAFGQQVSIDDNFLD